MSGGRGAGAASRPRSNAIAESAGPDSPAPAWKSRLLKALNFFTRLDWRAPAPNSGDGDAEAVRKMTGVPSTDDFFTGGAGGGSSPLRALLGDAPPLAPREEGLCPPVDRLGVTGRPQSGRLEAERRGPMI
eukprot:CAMPEP_0171113840 /NCGR_PEP_ID=MMETSP0766_2-20121228/83731_1 /TAXON_ID=439317 /ORGANISM="Gambierdiscus australes, Strain CAWD 149" /LENGTH=130 /DNA_ID=CAMNT_0011576089 /DNA_START=247 /DNA_END=636 /DNA_ORIENTATION=-